jgi:hypothetical protein
MKKKAWIVSMAAATIAAWTYAVSAQDAEYTGAESCKICHNPPGDGTPFKQWSESKHAHAFEMLKSDAAIAAAKDRGIEGAPHEAADCVRCHVTAYDVETKKTPAKISMAQGVQCETCHGPMSLHVADAKKAKLQKKEIDAALFAVQPAKELCVTCHNTESPTWDETKYTLADGTTVGFDFDQAYAKIQHFKDGKPAE